MLMLKKGIIIQTTLAPIKLRGMPDTVALSKSESETALHFVDFYMHVTDKANLWSR